MKLKTISIIASLAIAAIAQGSIAATGSDRADEPIIGSMGQGARTAPSSVGFQSQPQNNLAAPQIGVPARYGSRQYEPQGRSVDLSGERVAPPAWAQGRLTTLSQIALAPFGAQLFQGRFAGTYSDAASSDYVVCPGDRIVVRIWGARTYDDVLAVDQQGNLFLPEVGPVHVGGVRNGQLAQTVQRAVQRIYSNNVQCYVNLQSAQPVAVYVTGFVNLPGRYAGGAMDSVMSFIDRAGGINAERGSYRSISVKRGGRVIANVDLYKFLTAGRVPQLRLREGDVIVVNERGKGVSAYGLIREQAKYEFLNRQSSMGTDLMAVANPMPEASHVSVTGIRGNRPFNSYLKLSEFKKFALQNGDVVEFVDDNHGNTIMAQVMGAVRGASRYPVNKTTKLRDLLAQVSVEPELADLEGIYIRRRSVAREQKTVIADALRRLEKSVLTASSSTPEEAKIRAEEAKLVQDFVKRASLAEPDGVVVVARSGTVANIWLEDGDEVVIPQKSDVVLVTGEVLMPKAVTWDKRMSLDDYLASAGGISSRADDKAILVAKKNGEVGLAEQMGIEAGDRILVLPKVETKLLMVAKDITQIIYQIAVATKVAVDL